MQEKLLTQLEVHPDATLQEHCEEWEAKQEMKVSTSTMSRALHALGWTRKKTLQASERREEERKEWREKAKELDPRKCIFLDECGSNIALTRLYA